MLLVQPKLDCTRNERDLIELALQCMEQKHTVMGHRVNFEDLRPAIRRVQVERKGSHAD